MSCLVSCMCLSLAFTVTGPTFTPGAVTAEKQCLEWKLGNAEQWCATSDYYQQFCVEGLAAPIIRVYE